MCGGDSLNFPPIGIAAKRKASSVTGFKAAGCEPSTVALA
jgi:hypothetical protein